MTTRRSKELSVTHSPLPVVGVGGSKRSAVRAGTDRPALRAVDLFCGAGGLSEGLRQAGFDVVLGTDHDPDAGATYATNFPAAETLIGDIRDPGLRERVAAAAAGADVIVGGPPCQAYSQVRNHSRLIDDPRNTLYREFVRTVADAQPAAFVLENVPGMAQMGVQQEVLGDLTLDGEYLVTAQLVDAADHGVPQTRKRLLVLGVRASLGTSPPVLAGSGMTSAVQLARTPGDSPDYQLSVRGRGDAAALAGALFDPNDLTGTTASQAIGDLAFLAMGRREEELPEPLAPSTSAYQQAMRAGNTGPLLNVSVPRSQPDTLMRLAAIPAGGNHRDLSQDLLARYLTGAKWGPHNGSGRLGRSHFYAYRRLHPDIWAWTLNTKGDSVYHWAAARCLSVREFARLQSFPDRFVFTTDARRGPIPGRIDGGAAHSRYRQVGNAVPPMLAKAAASAVRDAVLAARAAA
jgi:DNA (cytosine-5)-methyltransferase 1